MTFGCRDARELADTVFSFTTLERCCKDSEGGLFSFEDVLEVCVVSQIGLWMVDLSVDAALDCTTIILPPDRVPAVALPMFSLY